MASAPRITALDRVFLSLAPRYALNRIRARFLADFAVRNFDAASSGRRTMGWPKKHSDANLAAGPALATLRAHSRDLIRNNGWAKNARRVVTRNVVGWGITPKPLGLTNPATLTEAWKTWAESTQCDAAERLTFAGLQKLATSCIFESGEVLIRRRWRRPEDGLAIPLALQVLEPDHLDTEKHNMKGQQGGPIIYGIEFDAIMRRVAYWLFPEHPGSSVSPGVASRRVDASEIIHAYDLERAGQDRGLPWLHAAIVKLKDFDEFEDAQLMQQKIAAILAAFIENPEGDMLPPQLGAVGTIPGQQASANGPVLSVLEPGMIQELKPGQTVKFSQPPSAADNGFPTRMLRALAAAIGVTYEDLTGDYSQVNFSSSRMARLAHWGNVYDWQWLMLIPQVCVPVWGWAMDAAALAGIIGLTERPGAEWTPVPMPLTDPDKEARANTLMIRSGQKTLSQVLREQGSDLDAYIRDRSEEQKRLDAAGIVLDSDPRRVSQTGQTQERADASSSGGNGAANGAAKGPMQDDDEAGAAPN